MQFKRNLQGDTGISTILYLPLLNLILLLAFLYSLAGTLLSHKGIPVKLSKTITSDTITEQNVTITITAEDVIYLNNKICTMRDLWRILNTPDNRKKPVLIKVDRRASAGRVFDVWDSCRQMGMDRINIASTRE